MRGTVGSGGLTACQAVHVALYVGHPRQSSASPAAHGRKGPLFMVPGSVPTPQEPWLPLGVLSLGVYGLDGPGKSDVFLSRYSA